MEVTAENITVNIEHNHGALFLQTVARMQYLKEAQLMELHRIVTDMWEMKRKTAREERQKQQPTASEHDIF